MATTSTTHTAATATSMTEACNKYGVASRFPEIARAMASEQRTVDSEINNEAAQCKDAEEQLSYFCIAVCGRTS